MSWIESFDFTRDGLFASGRWLRVTNLVCLLGILLACASALAHGHRARSAGPPTTETPGKTGKLGTAAVLALAAAIVISFCSLWSRYVEVNHFPSQTMSEVLVMFSTATLLSMFVLHFALKLGRLGDGWAVVDDVLLVFVFVGVVLVNHYSTTLSTAQRDLPPALQSYWFPPHLAALIFSYGTMGIAGLFCLVYFVTRFWSGVFLGGRSRWSQTVLLAGLLLIPFAQLVTIPVFLLAGAGWLVARWRGVLPRPAALLNFEKTMDQISYRAFAVGIPFLTAGLFMGAFWAQEAWANYWGWDSKENSALISWLVYVVYIHLRMLGGYRGEKAMAVLMGGALSVFVTFQVFGYLPDSQKSLHRYTDDQVVPREGMQGVTGVTDDSARAGQQRSEK